MVYGAFTGQLNNKDTNDFSTAPIPGDSVILEYWEPLYNSEVTELKAESDTVRLRVSSIVHGFRKSPFDFKDSGTCNIDVACKEGNPFRDQIKSVGILVTNSGQRFCSGALVNRASQDGTQYFLTANHCVFENTTNFIVGFNYQYNNCVSGGMSATSEPSMKTVQGLRLVSSWDMSDFALFEILETIPDHYNVFYSGWSRAATMPTCVVGVHHPSGDVKKISTFDGQTQLTSWAEEPNKYHLMITSWTKGITEPGSSGSPLFECSTKYIVGQLHGGLSSCQYTQGYDVYGGLAYSWDSGPDSKSRLRDYLDPNNQGVLGMSGNYYLTSKKGVVKTKTATEKAAVELDTSSQRKDHGPALNDNNTNFPVLTDATLSVPFQTSVHTNTQIVTSAELNAPILKDANPSL